jgi:long-chain acyl-CoA synthetase
MDRGQGKGGIVGLMAGPGPDWITAAFAALRAGAAVCPMDTQFSDRALEHVLEDSGVEIVFADENSRERLEGAGRNVEILELGAGEEKTPNSRDFPETSPDDTAALFYTSGTTGPPKGVPLNHGNLAFQVGAVVRGGLISRDDRLFMPLPLHHVYPFMAVMVCLCLGVPLIFPRDVTGPELARALREGRATVMVGVPRLYRALFEGVRSRAESSGLAAKWGFRAALGASAFLRGKLGIRAGRLVLRSLHKRIGPDLQMVASGGAPLDPVLASRLEDLGWRLVVGYGLTETSPLLTLSDQESPKDSVGRALPDVELKVDPQVRGGGETRGRTVGELLAKGPGVFQGYRNLPEKTEKSFTRDGFFRTGDLASIDEKGHVRLRGRVSTLLVTEGGENVRPDEIEDVLDEHPMVRESGVLMAEGGLAVLVVPDPDGMEARGFTDPGEAARRAVTDSSGRLASYKRPGIVRTTGRPLPRTRLGKIRRHLLEERFKEAAESGAQQEAEPVSPDEMSRADRKLVSGEAAGAVWQWLSQKYANRRLTPDSDLQTDLGVDSLEWVEMTMRIRERAGVSLPEDAVSGLRSVRDLLREVEERAGSETGQAADPLSEPAEYLGEEQLKWLRPLPPAMRAARSFFHVVLKVLMRLFFRLETRGPENVPKKGPFVLAPHHQSYIDPFPVMAALDAGRLDLLHWAGWQGAAFHNPVFGFFSRLGQTVPVDPGRGAGSSLAFGAEILNRGKALGWFPEGRRSPTGELMPFKPGIGLILEGRDVPVVPVAIHGAREAMPIGQWRIKPTRLKVVFGRPLSSKKLAELGEGEKEAQRITQALREKVGELMESAD